MSGDGSIFPRIASSRTTRLSNWVTLVENSVVASPRDEGAIYHSIDTMDYVSVLALTADHRVPLVRQYRPAVRRFTLEFPGGMRDGEEAPEACAIRELAEEAGFAVSSVQTLTTMIPDSGRLGNRMWTFFARDAVPIPDWRPESGVEHTMVSVAEPVCLCAGRIVRSRPASGDARHGDHPGMAAAARMKHRRSHISVIPQFIRLAAEILLRGGCL